MDQSHCVPGEARWRPQEPGPGEFHMGTKQPDPGQVQVGPQLQGPGEAHGQQDSPSPGEAQVATSHHPGADLLRIRFTRPR